MDAASFAPPNATGFGRAVATSNLQDHAMTIPQNAVTGALLGSWYAPSPGGGTDQIVFTFLADGTFLVVDKGDHAADPSGQSGLEWGTYTWNAATGAFTFAVNVNTDGQWGMLHSGLNSMVVQGDTLVLSGTDGSMSVTRVPAAAGTIVGSWYAQHPGGGDLDQIVITFLADGTFLTGSQGSLSGSGPGMQNGIEWGTYTWDSATGSFNYAVQVNTDGEWGLSHAGITRLQVSGDLLVLTSNEGVLSIPRVPNGQAGGTTGTAGADVLVGTTAADVLTGLAGNDILDGGAGIDTAAFTSARSGYSVTATATGYTVMDELGSDGTDTLSSVERRQFSDKSINLTVGDTARTVTETQLDSLVELYIAYINRVPDADGMAFWIGQLKAGQSLDQIGEAFYGAAVQFSSLTGYSTTMTNADFVTLVYSNVLGRSSPDAGGLAFWSNALASGSATRGTLVASILGSAHTFKGHAEFGYVADLLDNKIAVGKAFAISNGLVYNSSQDSITNGMAIAAAVTPTDTAAAIALIGVTDGLNLY
jgi:hypothetical protein